MREVKSKFIVRDLLVRTKMMKNDGYPKKKLSKFSVIRNYYLTDFYLDLILKNLKLN